MTLPPGVNVTAWQRGIDRARTQLATAAATNSDPRHQCTAKRCKQTATDLSGLCKRHLKLAADAARGRARPVFDPPTRPDGDAS